jgi:hypothetical protein
VRAPPTPFTDAEVVALKAWATWGAYVRHEIAAQARAALERRYGPLVSVGSCPPRDVTEEEDRLA